MKPSRAPKRKPGRPFLPAERRRTRAVLFVTAAELEKLRAYLAALRDPPKEP